MLGNTSQKKSTTPAETGQIFYKGLNLVSV